MTFLVTVKTLRRSLVVLAAAAVLPITAGEAGATPGTGVTAVNLSDSTVDGTTYVAKLLTIAPGGSTGWHFHEGGIFGAVQKGTLTHYSSDCKVDGVYPAGSAITERSGAGYVHLGRNEGPDPVVMWVMYANPAVTPPQPLATDMPDPGCRLPG